MRTTLSLLRWLFGLALLAVFTLVLVGVFRSASSIQQVSGSVAPSATHCAPTPVLWVTSPPTTPLHTDIGPVTRSPSVTPWPINKTTDLAPNIPDSDKGQLIVMHCDGTLELIWYIHTPVALQPGDVIIAQSPSASGSGHSVFVSGTETPLATTTGFAPLMTLTLASPPTGRPSTPTVVFTPAPTAGQSQSPPPLQTPVTPVTPAPYP